MAISIATAEQVRAPDRSTRASDRIFYSVGAWLCAALVFAGFSPSFFLAPAFDRPFPPPLLILHGVLLTAWFALYVVQTALIRSGRVQTHRRLGAAGAVLAVPVVMVLTIVLFRAIKRDTAELPLEVLTQQVLTTTLLVVGIAASIIIAILQRRNPAVHKRFMWPTVILLQTAGSGRLIGLLGLPWLSLPLIMALGLSNVVYDLVVLRRVHWASWCGTALVLAPIAVSLFGGALARVPLAQDIAAAMFR